MTVAEISLADFQAISKYVEKFSGIVLPDGKRYLVEQRLRPVMEDIGCTSLAALTQKAKSDSSGGVRGQVLDAISTQETSFFRDPATFDWLRNQWLPRLRATNRTRYDFWCAACSTGQEPYTLAMTLLESTREADLSRYHILSTDLSQSAVDQATAGRYTRTEIQRGLDDARRSRHFKTEDKYWDVNAKLRERTKFRKMNLLETWSRIGIYDLIMVRNVLIYFTLDVRRKLLQQMASKLRRGGVLVLGLTEMMPDGVELEKKKHGGVVYFERT